MALGSVLHCSKITAVITTAVATLVLAVGQATSAFPLDRQHESSLLARGWSQFLLGFVLALVPCTVGLARLWVRQKRHLEQIELLRLSLAEQNETLDSSLQQLRHSKERLRTILEHVPLALLVCDDNFVVKEWNRACERITGWSKEEVLGTSFFEFLVPEQDIPRLRAKLRTLVDKESPVRSVNNNRRKDGSTMLCQWNNALVHCQDVEIVAIGQDITQRVERARKLRTQAEQLNANNRQLTWQAKRQTVLNEQLDKSNRRAQRLALELERMISLASELGRADMQSEEVFLSEVFRAAFSLVPCADYGSVSVLRAGRWEYIDAIGHDLHGLRQLTLKQEYARRVEGVQVVPGIVEANQSTMPAELAGKIADYSQPIQESLLVPLTAGGHTVGFMSIDIAKGKLLSFGKSDMRNMSAFGSLASAFLSLRLYHQQQAKTRDEILVATTRMLEIHDEYTKGHSENVAQVSLLIAQSMGLEPMLVERTYQVGLVHDIGKVLIPHSILKKKGPLTVSEFRKIQEHPRIGYITLQGAEGLDEIATCVLHHHERWDGTGYPAGLRGEEIPLISQIIAVADTWDAMRSDRPYRPALSEDLALSELRANSGSQFSPQVVEAFFRALPMISSRYNDHAQDEAQLPVQTS